MSGDGGAPRSGNKTTSGDKTCCPLQVQKTCHVKKLKVTTTYKDRADYSLKSKKELKELKPDAEDPEGTKIRKLEANLQNNRIKNPLENLAEKAKFQQQVKDGIGAAKQAGRDAVDQTKGAVRQTIDQRSPKGVSLPQGPTGAQRSAMADGAAAKKELIRAGLLKAWDHEAFELLQRYDLVIETLASFYADTNASYSAGSPRPVNTVDIKVEVEAEGECPTHVHDYVAMTVNTNTGGQSVKATPKPKGTTDLFKLAPASWQKGTRTIVLEDVMAATIRDDVNTSSNPVTGIVKLLRMGWHILHPMDLEFRLHTCGHKGQSTLEPADLSALVRVYRETSFAIGVKVPPFKKYEKKNGQFKTEVSSTSSFGLTKNDSTTYKSTRTNTPAEQSREDIKEFDVFIKVNDVEITLNDLKKFIGHDLPDQKDAVLSAAKAAARGTAAGAKTVGQTTSGLAQAFAGGMTGPGGPTLLPFVMGLALTAKRIETAWKAMNIIAALTRVMERFPQCGYRFSVEWSFMEGVFEASLATGQGGKYETKSPILAAANDRYVTVGWKAKLALNTTVLSGKIEASFGLIIDFSVVGRVEARVVGQITGAVESKIEAEFQKGEEAKVKMGPSGKIVGRLYAVAALETMVYTWKREIGIEAGLQLDMAMEWTPSQTKTAAKIKTLPVQWYFIAVNPRTGVEESKLHVLYESVTVWEMNEKADEKKS